MIGSLSIKNYALIEDIRVELRSGLTIITGETGAGKSILLGALSLLLGKRADLSSVKNPSEKCIIEGEFSLKDYDLKSVFEENDLDYDPNTIIRREILPSGKSRAFVNDTPVGLNQLQALGIHLVDIHSQNEAMSFALESFQLEVMDALAGNAAILENYGNILSKYQEISSELKEQKLAKAEAIKELDYTTFLQNELEEANLKGIDQELLETTFETLNNAEEIETSFAAVLQYFQQEEIGTIETAKQSRALLSKLSNYSPKYKEIFDRLNSVVIEMEDIFETIEAETDALEADPKQLIQVNETLQSLYKLQQKHSVATVEELIAIETELSSKIDVTLQFDAKIEALETEVKNLNSQLKTSADMIHGKRVSILPELKEKLEANLSQLGLPNAQFKFEITTVENFRKTGTDAVEVYFTANKGASFGLLKKVASGGEMSRIMLSVKSVLAQYKNLPTIVFDEIDTGVSGEIALKMAAIMGQMSKTMQLISITHLPQIAAKGEQHIKVYKEDVNEKTVTHLRQLTDEERIVEIAQMIGGKNITDTTLANAKELLN